MSAKTIFAISILTFLFNLTCLGADPKQEDTLNGLSIGVNVGAISGDLINGVQATSPTFWSNMVRGTTSAHWGFVQNAMSITDTTYSWLSYGLFKLGVIVGNFIGSLPIRISSRADFVLVVPSLKISSKAVIAGLYGGLDLEFFTDPSRHHAVFVDVGGQGLFAPMADGLKGRPSFANGFTTSFGYRYHF